MKIGDDVFEANVDMIDVTSLHRPDTTWRFTDAAGHLHQWYAGSQPAGAYRPLDQYNTPTLLWVQDGEAYWEGDDEPHPVGHLECLQCGEHVEPGYCADTITQYVPGQRHYRINGEAVTLQEFEQRVSNFRKQ